jgi:hypothetical protein
MNAVSTFDIHDATSVCRTPIHEFFEQNWSALRNAAEFLGGRCAVLEAERLFEDLSHSLKIGVHTWRRLERMMRRLELDDDRASGDGLLHVIDPSDPIVDEICLLADGLRNAIDQMFPEPHPI